MNEIEGRPATIENTLQEMQGDVDTIAEVVDTEEFAELRSNAKKSLTALTIWVVKAVSANSAGFRQIREIQFPLICIKAKSKNKLNNRVNAREFYAP